ncbi:MAG: hypothetical protein LC800_05520 [Acidobacteria bacterium]|nr:hypothetical protein [Acidobacteriota bacterium]
MVAVGPHRLVELRRQRRRVVRVGGEAAVDVDVRPRPELVGGRELLRGVGHVDER